MYNFMGLLVNLRLLSLFAVPLIVGIIEFYGLIQMFFKMGKNKFKIEEVKKTKLNILLLVIGVFVLSIQFAPKGLFPPIIWLISGCWLIESSIERLIKERISGVYENGIVLIGMLFEWSSFKTYREERPRIILKKQNGDDFRINCKEKYDEILLEVTKKLTKEGN